MANSPLISFVIGGEIANLVWQSGPVAKGVLVILLFFSILSWSIILSRWNLLRRARVQSGRFLRAFRRAQRLQDIAAVAEQFKPSPLIAVFEGGYDEFKRSRGSAIAMQRSMRVISSDEAIFMARCMAVELPRDRLCSSIPASKTATSGLGLNCSATAAMS